MWTALTILAAMGQSRAGDVQQFPIAHVTWNRVAVAQHNGVRLELFASQKSAAPGYKVWFQSRITNTTAKPRRLARIGFNGSLRADSDLELKAGDRVLWPVGDSAIPAVQVMHNSSVDETSFFLLGPGDTEVLRSDSIVRRMAFPSGDGHLKSDWNGAKEVPLEPATYRITARYLYRHPGVTKEPFGFSEWRGRSLAWSKEAAHGKWEAGFNFVVKVP